MKKYILVTGGTGFIGSNLCSTLIKSNENISENNIKNVVICVDNLYCSSVDTPVMKELIKNENFYFMEKSVISINKSDLEQFPRIDEIYHLACPASPPIYQKDPIFTLDTNYMGTKNMLEIAKYFNSKILLASTSEIYGDPNNNLQKESYWGNVNTIGPRACYDEGKRISETLFIEYQRMYNIDIKIVRIFNTYGPYMNKDDGRVVSNFINQAIRNENITIYGDGSQTRSFCYVSDLIDGLLLFMNSAEHGPINLGNPNEKTVSYLANLIIELTNSNSKIEFYTLPPDDPKKRRPCIEKAKNILNWTPKISLEQGLKETISYYTNLIN